LNLRLLVLHKFKNKGLLHQKMADKKIKVLGKTLRKVDHAIIAEGLGAKIVNIPEISKEEAEQYQQLGLTLMVSDADPFSIYYLGSRHLDRQDLSIDDVVGYRILDANEEPEFRQQLKNEYATLVRYYGKKEK